jgi:hypothetical protein
LYAWVQYRFNTERFPSIDCISIGALEVTYGTQRADCDRAVITEPCDKRISHSEFQSFITVLVDERSEWENGNRPWFINVRNSDMAAAPIK